MNRGPAFVALLAVLFAVLAGCEGMDAAPHPASITHACTEPQMARAQNEAAWCDAHTGYLSTYCYDSAIVRNCPASAAGNPVTKP